MPDNHYTYIIAGGGCAGLSLACQIIAHDNSPTMRMLIIDTDKKKSNDRTWCFWDTTAAPFGQIVAHSWQKIAVVAGQQQIVREISPYRYHLIHGIDFYRFTHAQLQQDARVTQRIAPITAIYDGAEYAQVIAAGQTYYGTWVFDSVLDARQFVKKIPQSQLLLQHFYGIHIETARDCFDPDTATLFDFRTNTDSEMQFIYLLPYSTSSALLECTVFGPTPYAQQQYEAALTHYCKNILKLDSYKIVAEEQGVIPMTSYRFPRKLGKRICAIGTKGGRVKGSTGYAFKRIQIDSRAIAQSLRRHAHPFSLPKERRRFHTFDAMLIDIMRRFPHLSQAIFLRLFARNPIKRIFRLLDEEINLISTLMLMLTMPRKLFMAAYFRVKRMVDS